MKYNLFFLTALLSISLFAQKNAFKKGYFITLLGEKVECLVKDAKRKNDTQNFKYKLLEDGDVFNKGIKEVKEYGIDNESKFVRKNVLLDFSNQLSTSRMPDLKNKRVFLRVLLEGPGAKLYVLKDGFNKKFFFSVNDNEIEQLIYKRYNVSPTEIGTNTYYKQQLINNLNCEIIDKSKFNKTDYTEKQLLNIFKIYNECSGHQYTAY